MHDLYDMHGIFAPGFPGLLETFYVHERLIECLMPDVYESFVSTFCGVVLERNALGAGPLWSCLPSVMWMATVISPPVDFVQMLTLISNAT
jgi:hypothetical protein